MVKCLLLQTNKTASPSSSLEGQQFPPRFYIQWPFSVLPFSNLWINTWHSLLLEILFSLAFRIPHSADFPPIFLTASFTSFLLFVNFYCSFHVSFLPSANLLASQYHFTDSKTQNIFERLEHFQILLAWGSCNILLYFSLIVLVLWNSSENFLGFRDRFPCQDCVILILYSTDNQRVLQTCLHQ